MSKRLTSPSTRRTLAMVGIASLALSAAACGNSDSGTNSGSGSTGGAAAGGENVGVTLVTKDSTNPFFVTMQEGAKQDATKNNVTLTVAGDFDTAQAKKWVEKYFSEIKRGEDIPPLSQAVDSFKRTLAEARAAEDHLRTVLTEGGWLS